MSSPLFFSDYFKIWKNSISFAWIRFIRSIILVFRWDHSIKTIKFKYHKNWQFDNGYLIIDYCFKNAVWFDVVGIKKTSQKQPIVLDLKNLDQNEIEFIVHGLLKKKIFKIKLNNTHLLKSDSFKTQIKNIHTRNIIKQVQTLLIRNFDIVQKKFTIKKRIEISKPISNFNLKKINFHLTPFNQNDFI